MDVFYRTTEPQVLVQILKQQNGSFHKLPGKHKIQDISKHGGIIWTAPEQVAEVGRHLGVPRGGWYCCFVEGWTKESTAPWGRPQQAGLGGDAGG